MTRHFEISLILLIISNSYLKWAYWLSSQTTVDITSVNMWNQNPKTCTLHQATCQLHTIKRTASQILSRTALGPHLQLLITMDIFLTTQLEGTKDWEHRTMSVIHTPKPERIFRPFGTGSAEVEQIIAHRFLHRSPWKTRLTTHFKIIFPAIVKCFYNRVILYLGCFRRHFLFEGIYFETVMLKYAFLRTQLIAPPDWLFLTCWSHVLCLAILLLVFGYASEVFISFVHKGGYNV
jgi:hypothetical protein